VPDPTERIRWVASGRVQGVGFRWHVAQAAQRLGVTGWARNLPDGSVEVVAEGTGSELAALEKSIRTGPRAAVVENVEKAHLSRDITMRKRFEVL